MIGIDDRGLNYGDGLFETMRVRDGEIVWWEAHLARLRRGCAVLDIPPPPDLATRAAEQASACGTGVLKLVLTRGAGGRGYAPPRATTPTLVFSRHDAPARNPAGIVVRWCEWRLSQQPRLAGIKHLNRLENVLARAEWGDSAIAEGLLRDADERVIGATGANLFIVRDGRLVTPRLDRCGIAGVTRAWVMQQGPVHEADLTVGDIEAADELFLTNSLRGILPVARLGGREWTPGPVTRHLQGRLPA